MSKPETPANEQERLEALKELSILDTLPEKQYDDITKLASEICETPISQITLVDSKRQWYKSNYGIDVKEVSREIGFCSHTINQPDQILVVPDMRKDDRFADNPFVAGDPHAKFYAGIALTTPEGHPVGSICVIDMVPKMLTKNQLDSLKTLSSIIIDLFILNRTRQQLDLHTQELKTRNNELEKFASIAAHDIKSPLNNISSASNLIQVKYGDELNEGVIDLLNLINRSSQSLSDMINDILEVSKNSYLLQNKREIIFLDKFVPAVFELIGDSENISYSFPEGKLIFTNRTALRQIFINLITNAHKHNDKDRTEIKIAFIENETSYKFSVSDNGPGIDPTESKKIFDLYRMAGKKDKGHGIGLATVKRLVENMAGSISVDSSPEKGATFTFTIGK
ncbi:GAF sensor signal transduction histidine kinase [Ekhidna lutea]|uniref:histidine kinase n=1 Tax=Ekhidna lutea TaxID=447679 RepID=A0A239F4I2_EKHLU|nr:GAF domain-containing sensor histidine kinase [Ekhidna lutea]SNS51940.1 GAF sensor signal transduction histidine kinase [Ekhidna lutea]